jgi:hypothetical protein
LLGSFRVSFLVEASSFFIRASLFSVSVIELIPYCI